MMQKYTNRLNKRDRQSNRVTYKEHTNARYIPRLVNKTAQYQEVCLKYSKLAQQAYTQIVANSVQTYKFRAGVSRRKALRSKLTVPLRARKALMRKGQRHSRRIVRFYRVRSIRHYVRHRRTRKKLKSLTYFWRQRLKQTLKKRLQARLRLRKNRRVHLATVINFYRLRNTRQKMRLANQRRLSEASRHSRLVQRAISSYFLKHWRNMSKQIQPLTSRMFRTYFRDTSQLDPRQMWMRSGDRNEFKNVIGAVAVSSARRLGLLNAGCRTFNAANLGFTSYDSKTLINAKIYKYRYEKLPIVRADLNTLRLRLRRSQQISKRRKHIRKRMLKLILRMWKKITLRRTRIKTKLNAEGSARKWRRLREDFYLLKMLNKILFKRYFPLKAYRLRIAKKRHDSHTQFVQQWKSSAAYLLMHSPIARSRFEVNRLMHQGSVFYNNQVLRNPFTLLKRPGLFVQIPLRTRQTLRAFYQQPNAGSAMRWRATRYWDTRSARNYKSLFYHDYFKKTKYWTTNNWESIMWRTHATRFLTVNSKFTNVASVRPSLYIAGLDEERNRFQFKSTHRSYRSPDANFMQTSIIDFLQKIKT